MRIYYTGPLERAEISITNGDVLREDYVVNRNELFYKNSFGVLIRDKNGAPTILEEEVADYIDYTKKTVSNLECSILYADPDKLKCIGKKPEEAISTSVSEKVKAFIKRKTPNKNNY